MGFTSLYLANFTLGGGEQQFSQFSLSISSSGTLSTEHLGIFWDLRRLLLSYTLAGVQLVKQFQRFREVWRRSRGITGGSEWLKTVRIGRGRTALGFTQKQAQGRVEVPLGFGEDLVSLIPGSPAHVDELIDHNLLSQLVVVHSLAPTQYIVGKVGKKWAKILLASKIYQKTLCDNCFSPPMSSIGPLYRFQPIINLIRNQSYARLKKGKKDPPCRLNKKRDFIWRNKKEKKEGKKGKRNLFF
eukprot:sb/3468975/